MFTKCLGLEVARDGVRCNVGVPRLHRHRYAARAVDGRRRGSRRPARHQRRPGLVPGRDSARPDRGPRRHRRRRRLPGLRPGPAHHPARPVRRRRRHPARLNAAPPSPTGARRDFPDWRSPVTPPMTRTRSPPPAPIRGRRRGHRTARRVSAGRHPVLRLAPPYPARPRVGRRSPARRAAVDGAGRRHPPGAAARGQPGAGRGGRHPLRPRPRPPALAVPEAVRWAAALRDGPARRPARPAAGHGRRLAGARGPARRGVRRVGRGGRARG